MIRTILKSIAVLGFIGYLPLAPGTFASLFGLACFVLLKPSLPVHLLLVAAVTIVGTVASGVAERMLNEKDSSHIVIDEFAGYTLSVLLLPPTLPYLIAAFLLFRFFDILKPPPIGWIEKTFPGGAGVMADDLLAGIYTNVLLQAWKVLG
jgi:phosphatidylglycerophosphatase A